MNINNCWATVIIEELYRMGVTDFCIAPGSRSAPLTIAVAENPKVTSHLHFDERGLAYYALGLSKAKDRPVAIITTSGTAVANLLPAVTEAYLTCVPLILLTADRPANLIDCGANQAIFQPEIFTRFTVAHWNLPSPSEDIDLKYPITMASRVASVALNRKKPVHLNLPFAEPLYPNEGTCISTKNSKLLEHYLNENNPEGLFISQDYTEKFEGSKEIADILNTTKGIIWAGKIDSIKDAVAILDLGHHLGWPIITDSQSQLRQNNEAMVFADLLSEVTTIREILSTAETILQFGGRFISKRVSKNLTEIKKAKFINVVKGDELTDATYRSDLICSATPLEFCRKMIKDTESRPSWFKTNIYDLNMQLNMYLSTNLTDFSELSIVHYISRNLPGSLMLGNSLPARSFELCAGIVNLTQPKIYSNRGASGIDGIIATACGIARGEEKPVTLIIGDTSTLYDINSLALACDLPITIVILNNQGGNIFSVLNGPKKSPHLEKFFELKHNYDFEHAALMFGISYTKTNNMNDFVAIWENRKKPKENKKNQENNFNKPLIIECTLPCNVYSELSSNLRTDITNFIHKFI